MFLMACARELKCQASASNQFDEYVDKLPPEQRQQLQALKQMLLAEANQRFIQTNFVPMIQQAPVVPSPLMNDVAALEPPKKRKKSVSDDDPSNLPARNQIVKLETTKAKIELMRTIWDDKPNWARPLTSGAKSFATKHLNPIMNCLENHFLGDIDQFCHVWNANFKHTTFATVCCDGSGTACSPKVGGNPSSISL
jgi:hypothetical protein